MSLAMFLKLARSKALRKCSQVTFCLLSIHSDNISIQACLQFMGLSVEMMLMVLRFRSKAMATSFQLLAISSMMRISSLFPLSMHSSCRNVGFGSRIKKVKIFLVGTCIGLPSTLLASGNEGTLSGSLQLITTCKSKTRQAR